ncbi:MAG: hypothetical protein HFE30_09480 [Clostridiales bacterium]|nr:hypothetical protein [Clostridiales bacterium]
MIKALRYVRFISAVICIVSLLSIMTSCGKRYDENEIISSAKELIEASYEINSIYFGDGLPTAEYSGDEDSELKYAELSENSPYKTEQEIRDATLRVYSEEYAKSLFELAFTGMSSEADAGNGSTIIDTAYARYVEFSGVLSARILDDSEKLKLNRMYDTESLSVVRQGESKAVVAAPSFLDGVPSDTIELTLVMTDDGWRLDTPTY